MRKAQKPGQHWTLVYVFVSQYKRWYHKKEAGKECSFVMVSPHTCRVSTCIVLVFLLIFLPTLSCQARWESNSCYCFVIQLAIPLLPPTKCRKDCNATQRALPNSRQSLNSVCFTFSGRCWIGKFSTEMLIEWLWDHFRKCWFHNYATKSFFWGKKSVKVCKEF